MISVCVLSYNRLEFLKRSLDSMKKTATEPLEIIVHDDGSGPDVTQWLAEMVNAGEISHLILNPKDHNEGQGTALNRMFNMAAGDYIVKADQDLIYQPGWTEQIQKVFTASWDAHHEGEIVGPVGCLGLFRYEVDPVDWREMKIKDCRWLGAEWQECADFVGSLMAIPRSVWEEIGPFEEHSPAFAEDYCFKMKVSESGGESGYCLAITSRDFVTNIGFGEGPSTVVVRGEDGKLTSRKIKTGPHLVQLPE